MHIRSCILIAEAAILAGAAFVAVVRHGLYLRRGANYSLAAALGSGAIGGLLGAAGGTALCVVRLGSTNPGGGWVAAWLFRLLPFGVLGIVEGAVLGVIVGVVMAWIVSRRSARRPTGL
jgi:membrane associated rhomboid family serine protease